MSFLSGTATLTHTTPIPAPVRKTAAVARLHDHEFFLRCDPHYTSHTALPSPPPPPDASSPAEQQQQLLPADLEELAVVVVDGEKGEKGRVRVRAYEVVDHVPNPVWSSDVVSREELADLKTGLWVRLRSVLGVVMETRWLVEGEEGVEGEGERGLRLVQVVTLSCSRVLMPLVRAQVEGGWKGIHEKIVRRMVEDAKAEAEGK
ncbi:hypothetical protein F4809DRAFT_643491 [Biscogniauxia mediterranea]|nr:hypothetical protein F4809DRAFT_643491 [Biscogniauxia mediterranea]